MADNNETGKISDSVDAEVAKADATKNTESVAAKVMTDKEAIAETIVKAPFEFKCYECEAKFENLKEIRAHEVRDHKLARSPIPQIDGLVDETTGKVDNNSHYPII